MRQIKSTLLRNLALVALLVSAIGGAVAVGEGTILAAHLSPVFRRAFPSSAIVSERSLLSSVPFAPPNNGAPLTAPGRPGQRFLIQGKASLRTSPSERPPREETLSSSFPICLQACEWEYHLCLQTGAGPETCASAAMACQDFACPSRSGDVSMVGHLRPRRPPHWESPIQTGEEP